jgi:hypothetical protein
VPANRPGKEEEKQGSKRREEREWSKIVEVEVKPNDQRQEMKLKNATRQQDEDIRHPQLFWDWFQSRYLNQMRRVERQRWAPPQDAAVHTATYSLLSICRQLGYGNRHLQPTPANFEALIEEKKLLQCKSETDQKLDISLLLLQILDCFELEITRSARSDLGEEGPFTIIEWVHSSEPKVIDQEKAVVAGRWFGVLSYKRILAPVHRECIDVKTYEKNVK